MTNDLPFVVGIGASAGGIDALSQLFERVPSGSGMAFVVVTHLSPDRESLLHTILARKTSLAVKVVRGEERLEGDTIYVMPEQAFLLMQNGHLQLMGTKDRSRTHKPIDIFFGSLAEDQKENAAAIVLSGGDGDGTLGIKIIKEQGGFTFAQTSDGHPPLNAEMPQSAIATGFVDFAIPASEMADKLIEIRNGHRTLDALVMPDQNDRKADPPEVQATISKILLQQSGHDFSGYKSKTFFRRVARRMQVKQVNTLQAYCTLLEKSEDEIKALFQDLLISVTNFFRDTDAFRALEEVVIPQICQSKDAKNPVRVWVPACTTGEEVYSLAILISEYLESQALAVPVQIFATDIDEPALNVARQGRYPEQLLRQVSPERLSKFFIRDGVSYVVSKKVREMCIFSAHNVISDPPFSRMDMVSCRNLLIYFGAELQHQVIPTFHYALKPDGYLFLGTSESISQFGDIFRTIDKKSRIFQSIENANRRWNPAGALTRISGRNSGGGNEQSLSDIQLRHNVERHILEHHTPAHAVVREDGGIVFVSGGTGEFLEFPRGAPSLHLLDMVPRDIRLELRSTLRQVVEKRQPVVRYNLPVTTASGDLQHLNLKVEPLRGSRDRDRMFIVFFQPSHFPMADASERHQGQSNETTEQELRELRERLQSTIEEYETALEELKSSNEELVSVNEEAQSTNEELEASKEEMQSLNEELNTINIELNLKLSELDLANADLRNLFDATQIATVFLDADLVIRNFTPAAAGIFNLRPADIGRPLSELSSVSAYPDIKDHIGEVFKSGAIYEHRLLMNENQTHYLVRITPYLSGSEDVEGAVVTFIDVTSLAKAEEHQKILIAELNHRVKNMLAVVIATVKTSLRSKDVPASALDTVIERLHGMARAYSLLSERSWTTINVRDILENETAGFDPARVNLSGPNVSLQPHAALAMSMVLHELTTNAVKYGALSNARGTLNVKWTVEDRNLKLRWLEQGGPSVTKPEKNGFGYVLIAGEVERQLNGALNADFDPEGLRLEIVFPL